MRHPPFDSSNRGGHPVNRNSRQVKKKKYPPNLREKKLMTSLDTVRGTNFVKQKLKDDESKLLEVMINLTKTF